MDLFWERVYAWLECWLPLFFRFNVIVKLFLLLLNFRLPLQIALVELHHAMPVLFPIYLTILWAFRSLTWLLIFRSLPISRLHSMNTLPSIMSVFTSRVKSFFFKHLGLFLEVLVPCHEAVLNPSACVAGPPTHVNHGLKCALCDFFIFHVVLLLNDSLFYFEVFLFKPINLSPNESL
jgi:hypothetical protein